jgi:chromosome segregation ATPase
MSKPTLQDKLNMANKTVAELMEQNNELVRRDKLNNEQYRLLQAENYALKADYTLLENSYADVNKDYRDLLDKFTEISAENYALKSEIERTNRHINLAENVIHEKEQQPLVVNHYHNCTINK